MLSRNTYLIPSSHHPRQTTSVFDLDGVEILLHHQHQQHQHQHPDAFSGVYLAANAPAVDNVTLFNNVGLNGEPSSSGVVHHEPKQQTTAAKKDRHSKIHTAQGPRDRRVRLSIGIARKFFDLQEMLGFDKPSKTLDWLLTKSKEAIEELMLMQTKQKATASGSSPSECELLDFESGSADSRRRCNKAATGKDPQQQQAKESRAKARARARERTLEKMCIKELGGVAGGGATTHNASDLNVYLFQCRNINELEFLQLSAAGASKTTTTATTSAGFPNHFPLSNEDDLIEESIFIKRKSKKPSSSVLGFQQNLVFSRDLNSNYIIPSANANENWDVFGFTSQSNLHAILDQHRFINSNSNI